MGGMEPPGGVISRVCVFFNVFVLCSYRVSIWNRALDGAIKAPAARKKWRRAGASARSARIAARRIKLLIKSGKCVVICRMGAFTAVAYRWVCCILSYLLRWRMNIARLTGVYAILWKTFGSGIHDNVVAGRQRPANRAMGGGRMAYLWHAASMVLLRTPYLRIKSAYLTGHVLCAHNPINRCAVVLPVSYLRWREGEIEK